MLHDLNGIIGAAASAASDAGPTNSFPSAAAGGGSESAGVEADAGGSVSSCSRKPTVELPACTFTRKSVCAKEGGKRGKGRGVGGGGEGVRREKWKERFSWYFRAPRYYRKTENTHHGFKIASTRPGRTGFSPGSFGGERFCRIRCFRKGG